MIEETRLVIGAEMKALDAYTICKMGIPSMVLIENFCQGHWNP